MSILTKLPPKVVDFFSAPTVYGRGTTHGRKMKRMFKHWLTLMCLWFMLMFIPTWITNTPTMLIPMAFFFPACMTLGAMLREIVIALTGATLGAVWCMFGNWAIVAYNQSYFAPDFAVALCPGNAFISFIWFLVGIWWFAYSQVAKTNFRNFSVSGMLVMGLNLSAKTILAIQMDFLQPYRYVIPFAMGAGVCLIVCVLIWPETAAGQMMDAIDVTIDLIRVILKEDLEYLKHGFVGLTRDPFPVAYETLLDHQNQLRSQYDFLSRKRIETKYEITFAKFDPNDMDPILASILHLTQILGSLLVVLRTMFELAQLDSKTFYKIMESMGTGTASQLNPPSVATRHVMNHPSLSQPNVAIQADAFTIEKMEKEYREFAEIAVPMMKLIGDACDQALDKMSTILTTDDPEIPDNLDQIIQEYDSMQRNLSQRMQTQFGNGVLNMLPSEHLYFALSPLMGLREFAMELNSMVDYSSALILRCKSWKKVIWLPAQSMFGRFRKKFRQVNMDTLNRTQSPFYASKMSTTPVIIPDVPETELVERVLEDNDNWIGHSSSSNLYLSRSTSANGIPRSPFATANSQVIRRRASILPSYHSAVTVAAVNATSSENAIGESFQSVQLEPVSPLMPSKPDYLSPPTPPSPTLASPTSLSTPPLPTVPSEPGLSTPEFLPMMATIPRGLQGVSMEQVHTPPLAETFKERLKLKFNDFIFNAYQHVTGTASSFATKMTVAVFLSTLWVYVFPEAWTEFRLFWIVFTVVVTLNPFLGSTNRMGFFRALGSIVGAFLGAIVYVILPGSIAWYSCIFVLVSAFGSAFFLYTRYSYSGLITCVTYGVVLFTITYNAQDNTVWFIALERSLAVIAGVIIALLTMWFMGSGNIARTEIRLASANITYQLGLLFSRCVALYDVRSTKSGTLLSATSVPIVPNASAKDILLTVISALERSILRQILTAKGNLIIADDEPDLERPWDTDLYSKFLESAQEMTDIITSVKDAALAEEIEQLTSFIRKFKKQRAEMIGDACLLFHVFSGTLMQKSVLPPLLPDPVMSAAETSRVMRNHPDAKKIFSDTNPQAIQYFYGLGGALRRVYRQLHAMQEILQALFGEDQVLHGTFTGTWR